LDHFDTKLDISGEIKYELHNTREISLSPPWESLVLYINARDSTDQQNGVWFAIRNQKSIYLNSTIKIVSGTAAVLSFGY